MPEPEWFAQLQEIVAQSGHDAFLSQLTEWQAKVDVIVSSPDVDNMSFLVYRKKHGVLSLADWRPLDSGSELRTAIEVYLTGLNSRIPQFRTSINDAALQQLDVLKVELGRVGYELSWNQVEDWRLELSFACEGALVGSGKVYFGNSGLRPHTWKNNEVNEQFDQIVQKSLDNVAPPKQHNF